MPSSITGVMGCGLVFLFEHFAIVIGRIIRAIGISELDVRVKFDNDKTPPNQLKK